jgi:hypothetical protein
VSKSTKKTADRLATKARLAYLREQIRQFEEEEARLLKAERLTKATD